MKDKKLREDFEQLVESLRSLNLISSYGYRPPFKSLLGYSKDLYEAEKRIDKRIKSLELKLGTLMKLLEVEELSESFSGLSKGDKKVAFKGEEK